MAKPYERGVGEKGACALGWKWAAHDLRAQQPSAERVPTSSMASRAHGQRQDHAARRAHPFPPTPRKKAQQKKRQNTKPLLSQGAAATHHT